jgi:hypothetical protein
LRRLTLAVIAVLIVAILLLSSYLYLNHLNRPIKASSDEIVITQTDLPQGWVEWYHEEYNNESPQDGVYWSTDAQFTNSSIVTGRNIILNFISYDSVDTAHQQFLVRGGANNSEHSPLDIGDEGAIMFGIFLKPDPNGTYHEHGGGNYTVVGTSTEYLFREGNVLVIISFITDGDAYRAREQWMDDIVNLQEAKVHQ